MNNLNSVQKNIQDRYFHNLKLLKLYDYELYKRIEDISEALSSGKLPQRYVLKYVHDEKQFDVYDTIYKHHLLNEQPAKWAQRIVANINNDLKFKLSALSFRFINEVAQGKFNQNQIDDNIFLQTIQQMSSVYFSNLQSTKIFRSINKFIVLGTLHGIHLEQLVLKSKAQNFFICEQNLELFRLSLFVCDYAIFFRNGKTAVFSIMDNNANFSQKFDFFYRNEILENFIFNSSVTGYETDYYINKIKGKITEHNSQKFDFGRYFSEVLKPTVNHIKKYDIVNFGKSTTEMFSGFDKILFVAPGPSLKSNIKWLKKYQSKFFIVTLGGSLRYLIDNDIEADMVISLDSHPIVMEQFENIEQAKLDKIIKIFSLATYDTVLDLCNWKNLFTYEVYGAILNNNWGLSATTVGEVAFNILLLFNFKTIYMLGIDLAVDQQTLQTHIENAVYKKNIIDPAKLISVEGNLQDEVKTTYYFYQSLFAYVDITKRYKKDFQTVINLSDHGVYITNTLSLSCDQINVDTFSEINKDTSKKDFINYLQNNYVDYIAEEAYKRINLELDFLESLIKFINSVEKFKIKEYQKFRDKIDKVYKMVYETNFTYLINLYHLYAGVVHYYISFVLNDTKLYNDIQLINDFKKFWCGKTRNLLLTYKNYLESIIDNSR